MGEILDTEAIVETIYVVRGSRVILDSDLAALYGVPTKRLNEQVNRNAERFPDDRTRGCRRPIPSHRRPGRHRPRGYR